MSAWALVQIVIDLFLGLGIFMIAMRLARAPKDDPRLSRGLQLLQSKISVLEDLSDRTDHQGQQMGALIDHKMREIQNKIDNADRHLQLVRSAMSESLEVAKIFQDKIPHKEILERQRTLKYVQAARMAHSGNSVDEIIQAVDLPRGEVEFIAKVNRDELMFSENDLPPWARGQNLDAMVMQDETDDGRPTIEGFVPPLEVQKPEINYSHPALATLKRTQDIIHNLEKVQFELDNMDLSDSANINAYQAEATPPKVDRASTDPMGRLGQEFRKQIPTAAAAPDAPSALRASAAPLASAASRASVQSSAGLTASLAAGSTAGSATKTASPGLQQAREAAKQTNRVGRAHIVGGDSSNRLGEVTIKRVKFPEIDRPNK